MKIFNLILFFCLLMPVANAKELAGIDFADPIQHVNSNKQLMLNGLAIRYKFFFKIYVAALYVEQASQDAEILIKHDGVKRLRMHFLYDEVPLDKLVNGWLEGFENNTSEKDYELLKPRIDQFNAMFETLQKGDEVVLDFLPQQGTRVLVKGQQKGLIEGEDFNQALLNIWLGPDPVTEELKQGLLGIED